MTQNISVCESVVANLNYNYSHIQTLKDVELKTLKYDGIMYKDNKYIFHENMYNGSSEVIGAYIFVLPERYLDYFRNPNDDISFLINITRISLYDVIKEDKYEKNIYDDFSVNSLLEFENIIDKEDRQILFQEMNKQLDNFIKDSMHEINTPLSIINVNIDLYNRKNEENKYMQRMKAATKVLSNIYDDMDYLIKHKRLKYEKHEIGIKEFLEERVEYFSEVARMKNIIINKKLQECGTVNMNEKQLQRVIDNNISNAIKYSYENSTIDIALYMKDKR
ncbi:MAG: hypothetical protein SPLUMA1_SPLUMAMAG1_01307 [uncultured Sulfurimonas sp.]|nr:MAG: hypothetical protein SPLUMA1_SPLUMAMAG1_01307 [uncultured Sulfurimonas sp.]